MKDKLIHFWEGKGMFSVYLLVVILVCEFGDIITEDVKFSISRYTTLLVWYVAAVISWFAISVLVDFIRERAKAID